MPRTPPDVFAEALRQILARLEEAKARGQVQAYALIGGLAVSAWGIPRATRDLDFVVTLGTATPGAVCDVLEGTYDPGEADDPLLGVFHVLIPTADPPIPVQLLILPAPWPAIVFEQVEFLSVLGCSVPVVTWQVLLLLKLYAGGPSDLLDAREIWRVCHPAPPAIQSLRDFAQQVGLTEEFEAFLVLQPPAI